MRIFITSSRGDLVQFDVQENETPRETILRYFKWRWESKGREYSDEFFSRFLKLTRLVANSKELDPLKSFESQRVVEDTTLMLKSQLVGGGDGNLIIKFADRKEPYNLTVTLATDTINTVADKVYDLWGRNIKDYQMNAGTGKTIGSGDYSKTLKNLGFGSYTTVYVLSRQPGGSSSNSLQ